MHPPKLTLVHLRFGPPDQSLLTPREAECRPFPRLAQTADDSREFAHCSAQSRAPRRPKHMDFVILKDGQMVWVRL